jgi:cysteine desulfurase / selenocysteine lyase
LSSRQPAGAAQGAASIAELCAQVRTAEFARLDGSIYLNAASYGPLPDRSVAAGRDFQERRGAAALQIDDFNANLARARRACARLVNAAESEIALTPNTSVGLNLAADLVRAHCTDGRHTIVVPDREFPANVYGWLSLRRDGFRVEIMPVDAAGLPREDALLERLSRGDVAALAISAVQFSTGYRADLNRLGAACRQHGVLFVVDAIQALGAVPVDVAAGSIDVLACGGQKWLCGPFGAGFVYVRHDLGMAHEPHRPGWLSFRSTSDFTRLLDYSWDLWDDARRFETGSLGIQSFVELAHSIELILEVGVDRIFSHIRSLHAPLLDWANACSDAEPLLCGPAHASGIVAVRVADAAAMNAALAAENIVCVTREGAVRFAPHLYNTATEMERVVRVLRTVCG